MSKTNNQKTYTSADIVRYYELINQLQPAEQLIFDRLSPNLPTMKVLDLGVGAGRTTQYLNDRAAEYIGIDSSAEMIAACQIRFPGVQFQVCDARDMGCFETGYFDFVLFSFNGIDYVDNDDRRAILQEIHRVSKPKAIFCFSSHNLQSFEQSFQVQWSWNPIATYTNLVMLGILKVVNPSLTLTKLQALPWAIVKDESHNFRLNTYYIRPEDQIKQLMDWFENIQVYSWKQAVELDDRASNVDQWLYYCCTTKEVAESIMSDI
jgi:ubiquinone/menaquinone biosynthesis C-methylase UbiE